MVTWSQGWVTLGYTRVTMVKTNSCEKVIFSETIKIILVRSISCNSEIWRRNC